MTSPRLQYHQGTLLLEGFDRRTLAKLSSATYDERTGQWRAPGSAYRDIVLALKQDALAYEDEARQYKSFTSRLRQPITPRPHQAKALRAWIKGGGGPGSGRLGVVELPTGAGKTILALLAIVETGRSTLICVPTIDLLHQWSEVLEKFLGGPIGTIGGGTHDIQDITVSTYDSAIIHIESLGNRFGLLVADECHHLPAPQYQNIAFGAIAPLRLGLSATVERADGKEADLFRLMGPLVYAGRIDQMVDTVLSPYDVVSIEVPLTPDEKRAYDEARGRYTDFLRRARVDFSSPRGWMDFVMKAARMPGGRDALKAYREQKRLAQASSAKLKALWKILRDHAQDRVLVFTDDNEMAYRIGREFILPVLTHQTKLKERKRMLSAFREGELRVIVTSKVLNEGVDVPEARIGVVVSGSGGVREHVQRLGRILRHQPGKRAVLYEVISRGTGETHVNRRRKRHHAYQGSAEIPPPG